MEGPEFPSEVHQVERMLHTVFSSCYPVNDWMNDEAEFDEALPKCGETEKLARPTSGLLCRLSGKAVRILEGMRKRLGC